MSKQYLFRAFRYAAIALFLAAGVEGLKQVIFPRLSIWQSHIAAVLLCAFVVFLLSVGPLCREHASDKDGVCFSASLRTDEQLRLQSVALEAAANAIVITDQEGMIVWVNRAFTRLTGYSEEEILGKNPRVLKSGEQPQSYYANLWATISSGKVWQGEIVNRRKDGTTYTEEMTITPVIQSSGNGDHTHFIAIKQDISDRKLLQQQLQQAQKMEAVGRLAGGVAHDFNNMLGVITGYSELLKLRNDLDESSLHQVEEIRAAAKRAASLTQQLLAFSRKQIIQPRTLDLNQVLTGLGKMLRRLIGDDIELATRFSSAQALINVDENQLEQVVMNLVINARDAMPDGGKVLIETDLCELDEAYASRHKPVIAGRYVRLSVSDTGIGMDRNTMSHLFEPFFTTKELGRGTGLGLSIVYGIVKQSGGYIWVYSEPGHGTTFKIYLPLRSAAVVRTVVQPRVESVRGVETVLLVEDDSNLRTLMTDFLAGLGYTIMESGSGRSALEMVDKQSVAVQALITDIMMPGMGGRELANKLMAALPKLRVLYISGYTHDSAVQTRVLKEGESFLQKPFMLAELSRKLREVLDSTEQNARAHAGGTQS
jgi:two-component system, cell cycle sensor histidine kinase and response regulator CckA